MNVICFGGILNGFNPSSHASGVGNLKQLAPVDQPLVLICHGAPYNDKDEIMPEILDCSLHAVVLTHRNDATSQSQLAEMQKDLSSHCGRVFGLTRGWNTLTTEQREKVLRFLESDGSQPDDPQVQSLLGLNSPIARLTLRVALEIALRELEGKRTSLDAGEQLNPEILLSPAITVAQQEPTLAPTAAAIREALSKDRKALRDQIRSVLESM